MAPSSPILRSQSSPMTTHSSVPLHPSIQAKDYPKLNEKQAGHLRHFHNLVSQPDGEWHHFGSLEAQQEFDDAYRYQLATMAYATGAAHFHRLPALRGPMKTLLRKIIHKMLLRQVWGYWFTTSHGGNLLDPDLKELRKPWADPVIKENIMYSGHLLLMTSLYGMLFDDDEFEQEGSLTFRWDPLFWGLGRQDFSYDNRSLQKVIFQQMEENEWVGVCCEPNAVFVVCNQFPIIAMRYNDIRDGTDNVYPVLKHYEAALRAKGMFGQDGLYASWFALKQKKALPARQGAHTAWANAYMNSWNSATVHSLYDSQTLGYLTKTNGTTQLQPTRVAGAFRRLVLERGADPTSSQTLAKAREECHEFISTRFPYETISWGCFTQMLSELGKHDELRDLLDYADAKLNPTWENGGLFYPRNDQLWDSDCNLTHMEPHSGNSGIACARLNVEDGQRKMWENPWTKVLLASRPWIDDISYADGVDFLRAIWDQESRAMVVTLKRWTTDASDFAFSVRNLTMARWGIYINQVLSDVKVLEADGCVQVSGAIGPDEIDIIIAAI